MELMDFINNCSNCREWAYDVTTKTLSFDFKTSSSMMHRMTKWYKTGNINIFVLLANDKNIELLKDIKHILNIEISICGETITKCIEDNKITLFSICASDTMRTEHIIGIGVIVSDDLIVDKNLADRILNMLQVTHQIY